MKILGLGDKNDGCSYHRVQMPLALLDLPRENKLITNVLSDEVFAAGWDIVWFNRGVYDRPAEQLVELREKYGFKIVVDLDDWWELDYHHIGYNAYRDEYAKLTTDNLEIADLVTCTHERLREKILPYNKNVVVIPNAIPYGVGQFVCSKESSDRVRFLWCGSLTHEKDVDLLRLPMKRVWSDGWMRGKVYTTFAGYTDDKNYKHIADRMLHSFTCGVKIPGEIRGHREVHEYMRLYDDTDVSMIPLVPSEFTAMKSNLKVLEAAAAGNAVIVSEVDPYLGFPKDAVMYVDRQGDWYEYMRAVVKFPQERERFASRLREYCLDNYELTKINKERKHQFSYI